MSSKAKKQVYTRRVTEFMRSFTMDWTPAELKVLVRRVLRVGHRFGVDDVDLRSMVRLYNRELCGTHDMNSHTCEKEQ